MEAVRVGHALCFQLYQYSNKRNNETLLVDLPEDIYKCGNYIIFTNLISDRKVGSRM